MDNTKLLEQIGNLIDNKLDEKLEPIKQDVHGLKQDVHGLKQQLDTVELKVEIVNKKVEQAQEETVEALTSVIDQGYNMHEKRIKRIENHLNLPKTE